MNKHDLHVVFQLFAMSSRLQKKRAWLTIASIAWGTVAILLLLSFGEGLKRQLTTNSLAMGENLSILWPGETTKPWKGLPPGRRIRPVADDIELLQQRIPDLKAVIGEITSWRTALEYGPKTVNGRVTGVNIPYGDARKHFAQAGGRFLSPLDEANKRRVIFLGDEMAADIFGKEDPIGKTLLLNDSPYTVIGVMQKKTQMGAYGGPDADHAVIPLSTFRAQFSRERLSNIVIQTHKPEDMKQALRRVYETLGAKYGFDPSDERALGTWDTVKTSQVTVKVSLGIQLFLGIIGALTLLIGGVGVANIMYAVVKERTREIGVKMALGAKARWVVMPFILEGLVYTLVGGMAGIILSTLLITGATFIPTGDNEVMAFLGKPTLSPQIGVATSFILGMIGLLAGYFPARRAAAVDPAATLRYE